MDDHECILSFFEVERIFLENTIQEECFMNGDLLDREKLSIKLNPDKYTGFYQPTE